MVERRSCPGKIGCKLKTKGRHSRPCPYSLPLGFSCKEEALYLGRFFASTPACIGINSDLGLSSRPPPGNRLWAQAARFPGLRFLRGSAAIDHGRRPGSNFSPRRQAGDLLTHGCRAGAAAVGRRRRTTLSNAAVSRCHRPRRHQLRLCRRRRRRPAPPAAPPTLPAATTDLRRRLRRRRGRLRPPPPLPGAAGCAVDVAGCRRRHRRRRRLPRSVAPPLPSFAAATGVRHGRLRR